MLGVAAVPAAQRTGSDDRDRLIAIENDRLAARLQRLGPAMVGMASDLAGARREIASLKRENRRLRALLGQTPSIGAPGL